MVSTTYIIEMAPQHERGSLGLCCAVASGSGSLGVALVAWLIIPTLGWRWFTGAVTIPFFCVLGESSRWLVSAGRLEGAMETLAHLASVSVSPCLAVL